MSRTAAIRMLQNQFKMLKKNPLGYFKYELKNDEIFEWNVWMIGPIESSYEGGKFKLLFEFPEDYPFQPPTVKFVSEMWHPNVEFPSGKVCMTILKPPGVDMYKNSRPEEMWLPIHTPETILLSIMAMLVDPVCQNPANVDCAVQFKKNRKEFNERVKKIVEKSQKELPNNFSIPGPRSRSYWKIDEGKEEKELKKSTVDGPGLFDKTSGGICSLKKIDHTVKIEEEIANIETHQYFVNETGKNVEMIYRFPLIVGTSPHKVRIEILDPKTKKKDIVVAKAEEKKKAQERYDDGISEGNTVVLMEKSKDKHVSLQLGNVPSGNEVCVISEMVREMTVEFDKTQNPPKTVLRLEIPAIHNRKDEGALQRSMGNEAVKLVNVKTDVRVYSGEISKIYSVSHESEMVSSNVSKNKGELKSKEPLTLEKEINVIVEVSTYEKFASGFVEILDDKTSAAQISLFPHFSKERLSKNEFKFPIEHILLVDRSGSMGTDRMNQAKQSVKLFVKSLDVSDSPLINLIGFGSTHSKLFPVSVKFDESSFEKILKHVESSMDSDLGCTNIHDPLKDIIEMKKNPGYDRIVYLITDGEADNPSKCKNLIFHNNEKFRIFSFGIGSGINQSFLTNLSKATNGRSVFIERDKDIRRVVIQQLSHANEGNAFRNLKIEFSSLDKKNVECVTEISSVLYNLTRNSYYFLISKGIPQSATISFKIGNEEINEKVKLEVLNDTKVLGVFTALKKVKKLEKNPHIVENYNDEILKLGLKYNILTPRTSFVGVRENVESIEEEMISVDIPTIPYKEIRFINEGNGDMSLTMCEDDGGDMSWDICVDEDEDYEEEEEEGEELYSDEDYGEEEIEEELETLGGDDWNSVGTEKATKEFKGTHGDEWIAGGNKKDTRGFCGFIGNDWDVKGTEKATKEFKGTHGDEWVAKGTEKVTKEFSGTHGDEWVAEGSKKSNVEFNGTRDDEWDEPIGAPEFSEDLFNQIIDHQSIMGNFRVSILKYLSISKEEKEKEVLRLKVSESEWVTAIVVAILRVKYKSVREEWVLLAKKSLKYLKNDESLVKDSQKFVEEKFP